MKNWLHPQVFVFELRADPCRRSGPACIIRYTRKQWGAAQVRRYVEKLKTGMANIAAEKGVFKQMDALYPKLCVAHCEHHCIFCLKRENAPALIVAIFHERMDLMLRIADRLR